MTRRRALAALAVLSFALAAGSIWWLTRKPLSFESRASRTAEQAPLVLQPAPDPSDAAALVGDDPESDDTPLDLPAEVIEQIQIERAPTPAFRRTENYLLVGVDRTWGRSFGRADSMVVVVFDDDTGHVGVISIPRDLYVDVPGHGPARINATLRIGGRIGQNPLTLASRVVSDTLVMPIHHVMVGDLSSFERTVDRLGGVEVEVACPIADNFIDPRTEDGRRILDVDAGRRHMDGVTAAMYVRSRHGRSDLDRARRQQTVLLGLRDRVRGLSATEWIPILSDAMDEGVTTTMSRLEMIGLGRRVASVEPGRLHGILIGSRQVEAHRTEEGRAVLLPNYDAIDRALGRLFEAPAPGTRPEHSRCQPKDAALR